MSDNPVDVPKENTMSRYEATGKISQVQWKGEIDPLALRSGYPGVRRHPVELTLTMSAEKLTGFDLTRPITITQEAKHDG